MLRGVRVVTEVREVDISGQMPLSSTKADIRLIAGKCSQCVSQGFKSTVEVGLSTIRFVNQQAYYDENGTYRVGDSGGSVSYRCSNGHEWQERS